MANTGFTVLQGNRTSDIDDYLVRRDLFNDGNLWGWGSNGSYILEFSNTLSSKSSPIIIGSTATNWKQVSCEQNHIAAIKTDGTLWLWGENSDGQLGTNDTTNYSSPVTTTGSNATNWKQVSCEQKYTAAIKTDGTLWLWGNNGSGQLGTNNTTSYSSPVTTVAGGTNWKQVACGYQHTAAIKTDGTLWLWGSGAYGMLGINSITNKSSPVTTAGTNATNWKQVSCGGSHTAAIKTDGTLWTWGRNLNGEIGDGTTSSRLSPTTTIGEQGNWKQVSCGQRHTAAIKTDGTLWVWGSGFLGRLGSNSPFDQSSPVTTIAGGTNWKQVACSYASTAAIKTDGTLWVWGDNTYGQLGTNNTIDYASPVTVVGTQGQWKQVSVSRNNTAAITDLTL